jgi:hypothetical protein
MEKDERIRIGDIVKYHSRFLRKRNHQLGIVIKKFTSSNVTIFYIMLGTGGIVSSSSYNIEEIQNGS